VSELPSVPTVGQEKALIEDCRRIIGEAMMGAFQKWYELGSRVKKEEGYLTKEYGDGYVSHLAQEIGIGQQSLYQAIRLVKEFPAWSDVEDFVTLERISWRGFVHHVLPDKTVEAETPTDKLWRSHYKRLLPVQIFNDNDRCVDDEDSKRLLLPHYLVLLYETAVKSIEPHELLESARKRLASEEGKVGE
jgi:hypothetical protein